MSTNAIKVNLLPAAVKCTFFPDVIRQKEAAFRLVELSAAVAFKQEEGLIVPDHGWRHAGALAPLRAESRAPTTANQSHLSDGFG